MLKALQASGGVHVQVSEVSLTEIKEQLRQAVARKMNIIGRVLDEPSTDPHVGSRDHVFDTLMTLLNWSGFLIMLPEGDMKARVQRMLDDAVETVRSGPAVDLASITTIQQMARGLELGEQHPYRPMLTVLEEQQRQHYA